MQPFADYLNRNEDYDPCTSRGRLNILDVTSSGEYCPVQSFPIPINGVEAPWRQGVQCWREVVHAVSHLPSELRTRILLVTLQEGYLTNEPLLNFLRVDFDIEPLFFWSSMKKYDPGPLDGRISSS